MSADYDNYMTGIWIWRRQFRRTTLTFIGCVTFLAGIGLAHTGHLLSSDWWWLCLPPVLLAGRRRGWRTLLWLSLFGLTVGWWRGSIYMEKLADYQRLYNHRITIHAVAAQDAVYNKYKQMSFDAKNVVVVGTDQHLTGKVSLSGFGLNAVFAGDEIEATGTLKSSLGSYQGRMSFGQLTLMAHHNTIVNELRRRLTAGTQSALPEPLAPFGMGLLIGQRNTLPPNVAQSLLMVGLTHIIAVSGYNLTILLRAANKLGAKRSKRVATGLSLALIGIFLLFAGTSASIVRAAIVSLFSIAAGYYGRQFKPLVLIMLAAVTTAFANPCYIWSDTSWYLSFLAFYGVMVLAPMVRSRWKPKWQESLLLGIALESMCAEMLTLPLILHLFGQMSFAGLISNTIVTTLVPLAMLVTVIAGLAGMTIPALAGWLAWPARLILTYMLDTVTLLSRIPGIFAQNLSFSTIEMIIAYCLVAGLTVLLWSRTRGQQYAKITDRNFVNMKQQDIYVGT